MRHNLLTKHERLLRLEKATAERTITLTEEQTRVLERFSPEFRERHIEAPYTGALVAVDTFFVGTFLVWTYFPSRQVMPLGLKILQGHRQDLSADRD